MIELYNTQAEKQVLAGLILDEQFLVQTITQLGPSDFYLSGHQYLYEIIQRFYYRYYQPITHEVLANWLTKHDLSHKSSMLMLFAEAVALGNDKYSRYYVDELHTLSAKRRLVDVYKQLQTGLEGDEDPQALHTNITRAILTSDSSTIVERTSVFDNPDKRMQVYQDKRDHPEKYQGLLYGIKEVDEITGGMFPGQLYLVMGRSGHGKSRTLFTIGCNVAKANKKVMYCTIEMDAVVLQQMWESRATRIPLTKIMRATLSPEEEKKYFAFLKLQHKVKRPFYIVDIPQGCTTGVIEAEVSIFEKIHGQLPDIVLIDYATLIQPVSKYRDRAEKYDHVFRELKEAARAHGIVYYTATQLNRESVKASRVGTEHAAFSDATSYHCDSVFRVYADEKDEINSEVHFQVIKGRYHKKQSATLFWDRETNYIGSWDNAVKSLQRKDAVNSSNVSGSAGESETVQYSESIPSTDEEADY